ncbi:hypothetical protein, partial [Paraliobacillus quinghaiensis]
GFLQILSHDRHPCLSLTVPTAKSVVDFHHLVITHAGRTIHSEASFASELAEAVPAERESILFEERAWKFFFEISRHKQ